MHYFKKLLLPTLLVLLLLVPPIVSWCLLDYSLTPESHNRDYAYKWAQADSLYPGLHAWHDSLQAIGQRRDTFITAPDGARLHAVYVRASQPTRHTAVLVHGYTDCHIDMMHLGRMYHRDLHMNILLPDLRYAGKSEGTHIQMGWLDRLDVKQWIRSVPQLFGDSTEVVVHGVSMGAATTMMVSGDHDVPPYVQAYVEDCGYTSVDEQFSKELKERFFLPRIPFIPLASVLCNFRYGWKFEEASPLHQVAQCTRPMLFIHGTADAFVPTRMVYPLYAAHPGPKALWLTTGTEHAKSYYDYPQEYTQRVSNFLKQHTPN